MSPIEIAQFVGIPVAVATVLVFLSWAMTTTNRHEPMGAIVALGIASFIAFVLQEGIPTLPPAQKWHWLILSLFAVWALACIYPCFKKWDEMIVLQAIIAGVLVSVLMQFPAQQDFLFRVLIFVMVLDNHHYTHHHVKVHVLLALCGVVVHHHYTHHYHSGRRH